MLPPAPTVSSSRTHVDHEPELTSAKITTASDNDAASHDSSSQADSGESDNDSDSGSDHDTGGHSAKIMSATVHIGPPPRSQKIQPSEPITATADTSDHGNLDVKMHSPPHGQSSQRGRACTVKAVGSFSGSQVVRSSGASNHMEPLFVAGLWELHQTLVILTWLMMMLLLILRALSTYSLPIPDQPP